MISKRLYIGCIFIVTLAGYGFGADIEEGYRDIYDKILGDSGIYERYLPKSKLIQLQGIRQTLTDNENTEKYDVNHILRVSKRMIDELDKIVLLNLADRLDITARKYERIQDSNPQLQARYAEFIKKKTEFPELFVTKSGMEEIEAYINTVDALYAQANWEEAPRSAPPGNREGNLYLVQEGDFLRKIAQLMYGDERNWTLIYRANPDIKNPDLIYPGMEFQIPPQN